MKIENRNGITLIVLIITIIILLILAGVSIAMLVGENGILSKTILAKNNFQKVNIKEKVQVEVLGSYKEDGKIDMNKLIKNLKNIKAEGITENAKLPLVITVENEKIYINENGNVIMAEIIPSIEESNPFLPLGAIVINDNFNTGITIKDSNNNEWVWIEVPKNITKNMLTDEEIKNALKEYTKNYNNSSFSDIWYEGCGLTKEKYEENYNKMLKSVKENGGFYIGRYEAGDETTTNSGLISRNKTSGIEQKVVLKQDMHPYNFINCSEAQKLAERLNVNKYTSSVMYGIQWDLICKYIEEKGAKTLNEIKVNSTNWGNYYRTEFTINKGRYYISGNWKNVNETYTKKNLESILLTTGATDRNCVMNIYDLVGNQWEYTLENRNNYIWVRAGSFDYENDNGPLVLRRETNNNYRNDDVSFRPTLF